MPQEPRGPPFSVQDSGEAVSCPGWHLDGRAIRGPDSLPDTPYRPSRSPVTRSWFFRRKTAHMHAPDPGYTPALHSSPDQERERRLELLVRRLPFRIQSAVRWLRRPDARWVRIPAGLLLMAASLLSILPIFGLWMLLVTVTTPCGRHT